MITLRRLQNIRSGMYNRTNNPKDPLYSYYGEKGIVICDEWKNDSNTFIEWALNNQYHDGLEIDRIDNTKGYFPNNCRWTDRSTNCCNRGLKSTNKTGYIGITLSDKSHPKQPYRIYLRHKGVTLLRKRFIDKEKAMICRERYIIENNMPHSRNLTNEEYQKYINFDISEKRNKRKDRD